MDIRDSIVVGIYASFEVGRFLGTPGTCMVFSFKTMREYAMKTGDVAAYDHLVRSIFGSQPEVNDVLRIAKDGVTPVGTNLDFPISMCESIAHRIGCEAGVNGVNEVYAASLYRILHEAYWLLSGNEDKNHFVDSLKKLNTEMNNILMEQSTKDFGPINWDSALKA